MPLPTQQNGIIIKSMQKDDYLYKLTLSDGRKILCDEDDIFNYFLEVNKEIKENIIDGLLDKNNYYLCLNKAFKLINQKSYAKKQIEQKLSEYQFVDEVINYLQTNNLINDEIYAQDLCEAKKLQGYGPKYINNLLKQLDIEYPIEYSFEEEYSIVMMYYEKSKPTAKGLFERKFKDKMHHKGFNFNVIEEVLNNNQKVYDDAYLRKEFEKTHAKYQKKYSGYQLKNKIYQYLLTKGYDKNELENIMEEIHNES